MSWSFRVFAVEQFGHANKENKSDMMDKSIHLNPVGNTESFGSPINSTLLAEIVKGSNKLFAFAKLISLYMFLYNSFFYYYRF